MLRVPPFDVMNPPDPLTGMFLGPWRGTIRGVLVGLGILILAFPLVLWNESSTILSNQIVDVRLDQVISVVDDTINTGSEGRLIHLSGMLTPITTQVDPEFGLSLPVLKLQRQVETYQWVENRTGTEATYGKAWLSEIVDSSTFLQPDQHRNPASARFSDWESSTGRARLGAFDLPQDLLETYNLFEPVKLTQPDLKSLAEKYQKEARLSDGMLSFSKDAAKPRVGDVRIRYVAVKGGIVSVIGRQSGTTLAPYVTQAGYRVYRLSPGKRKGVDMSQEQAPASIVSLPVIITWALRLTAWAMVAVGLLVLLERAGPWAETTPVLRDLVAPGPRIFAAGMAAGTILATIGFAWMSYSWLWAAVFSASGMAIFVGLHRFGQRVRQPPST